MENLLNGNIIIGVIVSLLGGVIASFSPCNLSSISIIIGYIAKTNDRKNNLKYSIIFAFGTMVTFIGLSILSTMLGKRLSLYNNYINIFLSIILILVSLNMFGVIKEKNICKVPKVKKNIFMAFFLGIIGGMINSPCSIPILISILSIISIQKNIILGIVFMLFYSIGSSISLIIAGYSVDLVQRISTNEKYKKISKVFKTVFGIITLVIALYLLYLVF